MNAKKAKALRKLARSYTAKLPDHAFKEMGINSRLEDDKTVRITAPLSVGSDTKRGQYIALKKSIKEQYPK